MACMADANLSSIQEKLIVGDVYLAFFEEVSSVSTLEDKTASSHFLKTDKFLVTLFCKLCFLSHKL